MTCSKHTFDLMVETIQASIPVLDKASLLLCKDNDSFPIAMKIATIQGTFESLIGQLLRTIDPPVEEIKTA